MNYKATYQENAVSFLPKAENKIINIGTGGLDMTVQQILKIVEEYSHTVKPLAYVLRGNTLEETLYNIWHFIKRNTKYKEDRARFEELRTPARLFHDGIGDCDDYSITAISILKELGYKPFFYIVAYSNSINYAHIYTGVKDKFIDPVMPVFGKHAANITKYKKVYLNGKEIEFLGSPKQQTHMNIQVLNGIEHKVFSEDKILQILAQHPHRDVVLDILEDATLNGDSIMYANKEIADLSEQYYNDIEKAHNEMALNGLGRGWWSRRKKKIKNAFRKIKNATKSRINKIGKATKKVVRKIGNSKVVKSIKKYSLFPVRTAYLGLLKLNFLGHASKLAISYLSESKVKELGLDKEEFDKLVKARKKFIRFWEKMEGNEKDVKKAIKSGIVKKALKKKGIQGLGSVTATLSGAATAVIVAFKGFFKKINFKKLFKSVKTVAKRAGRNIINKIVNKKIKTTKQQVDTNETNETNETNKNTKKTNWILPAVAVAGGLLLLKKTT